MRREIRQRWFLIGVMLALLFLGCVGIRLTGDLRWALTSVPGILLGLWVLRPIRDDDKER